MIKAEKGKLAMQGSPALLEIELIASIKAFYLALVEKYGEEFADRRMDLIMEKALESDETEADKKNEAHESIKEVLDTLHEFIKEMEGEM